MDLEWTEKLKEEFNKEYFKNLQIKIDDYYSKESIFPDKSKIFNAFELCSFSNLKVYR